MSYGQYSANGSAERTNPLKTKTQGKRTKQVYKTDEIPHLWAHKTQESARNAQGNLYFDGDTIYSYGSHFPIARHVTSDITKRAAVFFTTQKHSVTTASHVSAVHRAIPGILTFEVYNILDTPIEQVRRLERNVRESACALHKGSVKPLMHRNKRAELYHAIVKDVLQARAVQEFFGFKARAEMPAIPEGIHALIAEVQATTEKRHANQNAINEKKWAKDRAKRERQRELDSLSIEEKITAWRNGEPVRLSGYWNGNNREVETMLRIVGTEVETSRGAVFPLSHAIRALTLYRAVRARGEAWARNGHSIHLGHYQIDVIDADGTIRAGCHVVSASEVEHFMSIIPYDRDRCYMCGAKLREEERTWGKHSAYGTVNHPVCSCACAIADHKDAKASLVIAAEVQADV